MRPFALSARLTLNALVNSMPSCRHCPQSLNPPRNRLVSHRHALVRARHHSFVLVHARRHLFSLVCAHLCSLAPVCAHSYLPVVACAQIPALVPVGKPSMGAGAGLPACTCLHLSCERDACTMHQLHQHANCHLRSHRCQH